MVNLQILGYNISRVNKQVVPIAKKEKAPENPVGVVGMRTSSGFVEEEFLYELRWPQAGKVYQEMASNDAIIGGSLYLIETILRKAKWSVKSTVKQEDGKEAKEDENAKFIESCMFDMSDQTWDDFICEVLSMLIYGYSFHEVLYKVRRGPEQKDPRFKSKYSDGKIGWQEIPVRSQASISEWVFDEKTGKPIELIQDPGLVGGQGDKVNIPLAGNLLFRTRSARNNPEGQSILRRAYRSWFFKRYIEELEGIGVERNLAGIPVLKPDENTQLFDPNNQDMVRLLNWAQDLVNGLRQDREHGIILPFGWELELIASKGNASIDTDKIIHRHEARMAMTMLADIVVMGGDRTGSFALAEVKQSFFLASVQAIANSICAVLNTQAIPRLLVLNGIVTEDYPEIVVTDLKQPEIKEIALLLRSMGVDITQNKELLNYLLNVMRAPELSDEEFNAMTALAQQGRATEQDNLDAEAKQSDLDYM